MSNETRTESRSSLFSIWLHQLNQRAEKEWGVSIFDLPDVDYYQAFEEERLTISQMLERLQNEFE